MRETKVAVYRQRRELVLFPQELQPLLAATPLVIARDLLWSAPPPAYTNCLVRVRYVSRNGWTPTQEFQPESRSQTIFRHTGSAGIVFLETFPETFL